MRVRLRKCVRSPRVSKGDSRVKFAYGEWKLFRPSLTVGLLTPASLVALAEASGMKQIFTLDTDFFVYRIGGKDSFDVIP